MTIPNTTLNKISQSGSTLTTLLGRIGEHSDYSILHRDPCWFSQSSLGLRSPLNLPDIDKAVHWLQTALTTKCGIWIVGDRDVDGISSTALLADFVRSWDNGGRLEVIASDGDDDYGLSGGVYTKVRELPVALVILLDMGTSNGPEIAQLKQDGKKVIVLDHHQLHERVADSNDCAFVNPYRDIGQHPVLKGKIATVALVFKLLLSFVLSHTRDWQRIYCLPLAGAWWGFRCGLPLGSHETFGDWQQFSRDYFQELSPFIPSNNESISNGMVSDYCIALSPDSTKPSYNFTEKEWELMQKDVDYAGKLILSHTLETRPRLRSFTQKISDLAALGTLSDMMPLIDENRAMVRIGIGQALYEHRRGNRSYRTGCDALIRALGLHVKPLLSRDLAWAITPTINAAGRMGNSRLALDLLLCEDPKQAQELAKELVRLNESRKRRTKHNARVIEQHFIQNHLKLKQPLLFCYHPKLKPGVSGILASRLCEQYNKPVVYINDNGSHAKGSIRTWNGINVLDLLDTASELFMQFGGHPEAAGFSIAYENIELLEEKLQNGFSQINPQNDSQAIGTTPKYHIELRPAELQSSLLKQLERLEPFGIQNPEPIIRIRNVIPLEPRFMSERLHVSFRLPAAPRQLKFIAWRQGAQIEKAIHADQSIDIYGSLEESVFRGWREFCFRIEKITPSGEE